MDVPHDHPHQIQLRNAPRLQDIINRRGEVLGGVGRGRDWVVGRRRLVHFRWPRRAAVAANIDQKDVVALLRDQVHHRYALDRQIESRLSGVCRAMNEKQGPVSAERRHPSWVLVAHIKFDPRIDRGDRKASCLELRRRRQRRRRICEARQEAEGNGMRRPAHSNPPGWCRGTVERKGYRNCPRMESGA